MPTRFPSERLIALLKSCPLFSTLPPECIEQLVAQSSTRTYFKGDVICHKGQKAAFLHFLLEGEVLELVVDRNDFRSVAKTRYAGEFFSELSLILEEPSATAAISQGKALILHIPGNAFLALFWSSQAMVRYVLSLQGQRLVQAAERSASHTLIRTEGRLAFALITLENEGGQPGVVKATHEFIGQYCGLARQTVSTLLDRWRKEGWVDTHYRQVRILNATALSQLFFSDSNYRS